MEPTSDPQPTLSAPAEDRDIPAKRLGVGVTGHRLDRLDEALLPALKDRVDSVIAAIEEAAGLEDAGQLRLVTSLAEGADSIAAQSAKGRGWQVDAVLPYFRDEYAQDHPAGTARDRYYAILAGCDAVFELQGERDPPGRDGAAYERAGRIVLEQCDILIAIWDGQPVRGRGGSAQIVAEAVSQGIPVVHIDPDDRRPPELLWSGFHEVYLGRETLDSVARLNFDLLPSVITPLLAEPLETAERTTQKGGSKRRFSFAIGYPLLLAVFGIRRVRRSDFRTRVDFEGAAATLTAQPPLSGGFGMRLTQLLVPRFARADAKASNYARKFRSTYIANFVFAATAVLLSLMGLALPAGFKPLLVTLELVIIATILVQTRAGIRGAWQQLWLDSRALAEHLRCLSIASRMGTLNLRAGSSEMSWSVALSTRTTAREIGLPTAQVNAAYLESVRRDLLRLIDGQIAYLRTDAGRMHRLDHRMHILGATLFGLTALACIALLAFKTADLLLPEFDSFVHAATIAVTILTAALPALGAAIYGIRMQGDFAGIAQRGHSLVDNLSALRDLITEEPLDFDILNLRIGRVSSLMTADVSDWLHTYHARPLALPG
ncbi:hypothetical protein RXV95_07940 [Novosphingobium sp. ZN18A2]|uniref:hypothetical protein n=1 Tax=Novosphingobium sp. ZN18A2 TaxID=3079861 RepID=UPI0030D30DB9